jgi:hypothetical protein
MLPGLLEYGDVNLAFDTATPLSQVQVNTGFLEALKKHSRLHRSQHKKKFQKPG